MNDRNIESRVLTLGTELLGSIRESSPSVFDRAYWQGRMMAWAMQDDAFKVDLFRFIDVLPALENDVTAHVNEYLVRDDRELPGFLHGVLRAAGAEFGATLSSLMVRRQVTELARQFIAGRDVRRSVRRLGKLHDDGLRFSLDLLGEKTMSEAGADRYLERYLELVDVLSEAVAGWERDDRIDRGPAGDIPLANVSVKVSALSCHLETHNKAGAVDDLMRRVLPLLRAAKAKGVFVNFDMEQWALHGIILELFERVARHPEFADWPHLGFVIQAYLKDAEEDAYRILALAQSRGTPVTVRLVKGAYWDHEVMVSEQRGTPCPVFTDKASSDASFERLTRFLLEHAEDVSPAFGSHNLRSLAHALVCAESLGIPESAYEVQMLYGMAEPERKAIRDFGRRVRVYCPVGELLPGIAYLVRRLLENTANSSFLRLTHHETRDAAELMATPSPRREKPAASPPFANCAMTDFTDPTAVRAFGRAVETVRRQLPISVRGSVAGRRCEPAGEMVRLCPNDGTTTVADVYAGSARDADDAVAEACAAADAWRETPLAERVDLIRGLADRLERDRVDLAAIQTVEVAKPWVEADGDVVEAIDFCRYYAWRAEEELSPQPQIDAAGETNVMTFEGRGPTAVIAPWNFPLAILTGMSTAALVSGNPVIMKPAEESSAIALGLHERMVEVGFPDGVVQFLPGSGETVGARLVEHPDVVQVAFTGSQAVGLRILETAGKTVSGQRQVKRVICEMGGKNAIVVDADADVDEAVAGVIRSAFGYAGQKCSACSRVILVGDAAPTFLERFVEAAESIVMAPATDPACEMPPVVSQGARDRLLREIRDAGERLEALFVGDAPGEGWFVPPAVFRVTDPGHPILSRELFGPVVAVMEVETFEEAIALADDSDFALTGSVYSRLPSHLETARRAFRVGNLYLNRGSTGSIVGRQPFGGFRMSGVGRKAGGPGYLGQFVDTRVVTENTSRAGYTPDLEL